MSSRYELLYASCFSSDSLDEVMEFAERISDGLGMSEKLFGCVFVAVSAVFERGGGAERFDERGELIHVGDAGFFENFDFKFTTRGGVDGQLGGLVKQFSDGFHGESVRKTVRGRRYFPHLRT